jgi:hypothetical protein
MTGRSPCWLGSPLSSMLLPPKYDLLLRFFLCRPDALSSRVRTRAAPLDPASAGNNTRGTMSKTVYVSICHSFSQGTPHVRERGKMVDRSIGHHLCASGPRKAESNDSDFLFYSFSCEKCFSKMDGISCGVSRTKTSSILLSFSTFCASSFLTLSFISLPSGSLVVRTPSL